MVKDQLPYILLHSDNNFLNEHTGLGTTVTAIQRCRFYLQLHLNLHFHSLCLLHKIHRNSLTVTAATGSQLPIRCGPVLLPRFTLFNTEC